MLAPRHPALVDKKFEYTLAAGRQNRKTAPHYPAPHEARPLNTILDTVTRVVETALHGVLK